MPWKPGITAGRAGISRYNPFTRSLLLGMAMLLLGLLLCSGQWLMNTSRQAVSPKRGQALVRMANRDTRQLSILPQPFGAFSGLFPIATPGHPVSGKVRIVDYYQNIQRERLLAGHLISEWMGRQPKLAPRCWVSRFSAAVGHPRISSLPASLKRLFMMRLGFARPD